MDHSRFDDITRGLAVPSRRSLLRIAGAALLAQLLGWNEAEVGQGKKKKKKKKKKKCKNGAVKCGKKCVNPRTNALHCGGCGRPCGSNVACVNGACQSGGCPKDQCDTLCVDLQDNDDHCGSCGNACQGDLPCVNGQCACADPSDAKCGTACVDLQTDEDHCGGCGNDCADGQTCVNGDCVSGTCSGGLRDCGAAGCRECCNSADCCPPGRPNCLVSDGNRARTCSAAGVCECAGEYPYYCDALGAGAPMCWDCCESAHCLIDPFYEVRGMSECFFGNCVCPSDETLCPVIGAGNPPKCTDTQIDANNCGFCGNRCNTAAGQTCSAGACTSPGPP